MKKTIALCTALLAAGSAFAADEESTYAVTLDFPYVSKYAYRGLELARDSLQPSVEVSTGDLYLGVWSNVPLRKEHDAGASKEIDLYLGYTPKFTENLSGDFGLTYFWYPSMNTVSGEDSIEVSAGLNLTLGNFTPAVYLYRDIILDTTTAQASIGYSVPLKDLGTSLDLNLTAGAVWPDHDGGSYTYGSVGATVPVKLSDRVKLNFGLTYTVNDLSGEEDPGLWGTVGVTAKF